MEQIDASHLAERLERGDLVTFDCCPFALPPAADLDFLRSQRTRGGTHKDISYDPDRDVALGYRQRSDADGARLRGVLRQFAQSATHWLAGQLPRYATAWHPERVSFRPDEEAVRKLRLTARNDLLHFDAFPSRPTRGWRILRLFVNVNTADSRIWATSATFAQVLARYGIQVGLPGPADERWTRRLGGRLVSLFQPGAAGRTPYDSYMLRLHHFLKGCDEFQESSARHLWHFPPGSAWLLFTDGVAHAELRGQFALERSFFIAPHTLALPQESPLALLEKACGSLVLPRVA